MAIVLTDLGTKVKNQGQVEESIEHYKQVCWLRLSRICSFFLLRPLYLMRYIQMRTIIWA